MYNQDPRWLIPAVYLSSDRLFNYHLQQHQQYQHAPEAIGDNERKVIALAAQDYQFYFGGRLRKEDIQNNITSWKEIKNNASKLSMLKQLSDDFLCWHGDCFEVRREKLEAWVMLCSIIDPAWIIAYAYVKLMQQNILSEHELVSLITGRQCAFAFPSERNDNQYADNHVHFNGHGYSSLSMLSFIDGNYKLKSNLQWPHREEYTLFESGHLNKEQLPHLFSGYVNCLIPDIYPISIGDTTTSNTINYSLLSGVQNLSAEPPWLLNDFAHIRDAVTLQQRILYMSMKPGERGHQRWLLFCCGLMLGEHNSSYYNALSNLIRAGNILRNYMVVSAVGLGQFVEYFGFAPRRQNKKLFHQEVTKYDLNLNTSREYRVSPNVILGNNDKKPNIYHYELKDFYVNHEQQGIPEQAHIVVHFTRSFPDRKSPHDHRVQKTRDILLQHVRGFEAFNASVTVKDTQYTPKLGVEDQFIDLRKLVRGYDVAGNESELPIEIFAPVLRVLRAAKHPGGMSTSTRLQRPFITVHAGEDYSHLLSGLRAMDEAVEFCQLKEGDRLGHGLALGVNVTQWAQRQKRAYLTAGQYLDNLVWAYHQAVQLSQYTVEHIPVMHELRDKIHRWSQLLHNDSQTYTPDLLYRAWLLRRNWPDYEAMKIDTANFAEWVPDDKWLSSDNTKDANKAKILWQKYLGTEREEKDNPFNRVISINCQPDANELFATIISDGEDILSMGEIRLYEAIQDFLIEKYSRLGLVIEACPTSNIYIGRFEKYHEHPLFRWNPPQPEWLKPGEKFNRYGLRSGPLAVCINTDDSALMPTTIANEHRVMRETAIQCYGIGSLMADLWINSIRQKGVDIFKTNHLTQ
ncbi:TPA: hypothetical protein U2I61_002321 [Providencia rettgeri]|uniref:antiviral RADAR system adenosine deaminase RdrB n=1 Tax=Providencia sp. TaxID=589 RepID=UPI002AB5CECE|nr:hypothetical protein [Providencia rettgeri]